VQSLCRFHAVAQEPVHAGHRRILFFYTSLGSFIYFELRYAGAYDSETRTQIQSGINWAINAL
jgi:hypothetical protein